MIQGAVVDPYQIQETGLENIASRRVSASVSTARHVTERLKLRYERSGLCAFSPTALLQPQVWSGDYVQSALF